LPIEDYLMPAEEIKFSGSGQVNYGGKQYQLIVTNKRIMLYARRGMISKSDDVVSVKLEELHDIKYRESGLVSKKGAIHVETDKSIMDLSGPAIEIKSVYQQVMQFV
jgi:hypothetical protein